MKQLIQFKSAGRMASSRGGQLTPAAAGPAIVIALLLTCFALSQQAQAIVPAPDGGYPGGNTAEGQNALLSLTTGTYNTAVGLFSLRSNTEGRFNTGVGAGTLLANSADQNTATGAGSLLNNTSGVFNTANGAFALLSNTIGNSNTGTGRDALLSNTSGNNNTATGRDALWNNTSGDGNTANGTSALLYNTIGSYNTATGTAALVSNTEGSQNTATGDGALFFNTTGSFNTATGSAALQNNTLGFGNVAIGHGALFNNTTGVRNVTVGRSAGFNLTGDDNVCIGSDVFGVAGESNHTYIRNINTTSVSGGGADFVTVDLTTGLLGHASSSQRYKEEIKPMDDASETLFALKPVTFRYKKEIDRSQTLQYGLVAEDVAKVDPDLAIRDGKGQIESVHYSAINAMLLNEFLKEHKKVEAQQAAITELKSSVAQQQKGMENLTAQLKDQAAQIQKVSAQLQISNSARRAAGRIRRDGSAPQIVINP
jgi:trimeric autotransporter adhesin